jgi:hypothetical protein
VDKIVLAKGIVFIGQVRDLSAELKKIAADTTVKEFVGLHLH